MVPGIPCVTRLAVRHDQEPAGSQPDSGGPESAGMKGEDSQVHAAIVRKSRRVGHSLEREACITARDLQPERGGQ